MEKKDTKTKTSQTQAGRDAMSKADKAREHSQIDESGAPVDMPKKDESKTSDRPNKPDPRRM